MHNTSAVFFTVIVEFDTAKYRPYGFTYRLKKECCSAKFAQAIYIYG